jgi:sec-independent protein translocase protein TatA
MPNVGMSEILFTLMVILLLFGAKRIPEIARMFGHGIREFKKNMNEVQQAVLEPDGGNERLDLAPSSDDGDSREPKKLL